MEEIYEKICAGEDVRANLIELKRQLKEEEGRARFLQISGGSFDAIMKCLADDDPKARKNAADILGILHAQEAVDVLMDAYRAEETRYVRPDYLTALSGLDCTSYLAELHRTLDAKRACHVPENEKKHVQAEIAALQELILQKEGAQPHVFTGYDQVHDLVLTTLPAFREILAADLPFQKHLLREGIAVSAGNLHPVLENRYWQEMLFSLHGAAGMKADADEIAEALLQSDLMEILQKNHRGTAPFFFRIGICGNITRQEQSRLAGQTGRTVEAAFDGRLINSTTHYEAEIRLSVDGGGMVTPALKLFTVPDNRFRYRRYHVAAGMKPYVAAGLIGLAKPYLKENAQVLDPFCGVGTLLIERRFAGAVRSAYGIDTFGEAVEKARRNAQIAGVLVNYINRNFFDFTHDYLFDEIVTDLPPQIGNREETDAFYRRFLGKAADLLTERGRVFCYSGEMGLLKKHLRLGGQFRLLKEIPIFSGRGMYLFILERKV